MKLLAYFKAFLENEVNLNQSRLDLLDARVTAVTNFLSTGDGDIPDRYIQMIPQGSYAHGTIIKPVGATDEFDADLLLELEENDKWEAKDYVEELYRYFRTSPTYKGMVRRRTRCVVIDYANEFHIDVVPYVERHGDHYITNRHENKFELTNPEAYNQWLEEKNRSAGRNLIKVIRLLKYLRDYKTRFWAPSVILNTLIGERVNDAHLLGDSKYYCDVPTTLKNVLSDLDRYLQANSVMPLISDPGCPTETFNHRWDQAQYANFRKWIHYYSEKIEEAFAETDKAESLAIWQSVFGTGFKAPSSTDSKSVEASLSKARDTEEFLDQTYGIPIQIDPRYKLRITSRVLPQQGFRHYSLRTQGNKVRAGRNLRFEVERITVPAPYDVYWKVKNRGEEAVRRDCLRGQIVADGGRLRKDEPTAFRGNHYVECYVVKNGVCVAIDRQPVIIL